MNITINIMPEEIDEIIKTMGINNRIVRKIMFQVEKQNQEKSKD